VRVWRFGLTLLGGLFGLPGVTAGALALLVHLSGLESLGEAYLAPFSAGTAGGAVLRARSQKGDGT
jgi:spore germination protein KA